MTLCQSYHLKEVNNIMIYKIEFLSDWHCGSGQNAAADVDQLVIKDEFGLPFVPGKTLKGLLREAAESISFYCGNDNQWHGFINNCFGLRSKKNCNESKAGEAYFSNAELSGTLKNELKSNNEKKAVLFRKISSTAIDMNGQAKEHSLRKIEVTVPLTLFAEISNLENKYIEKMQKCFKWVKRVGTNRNSGLGRAVFSIHKETE